MQKSFHLVYLLLVCVSALGLCAADKKPQQSFFLKPDQTADLESPALVTAKQDCENWAVAAGIEALLRRQDVPLDQTFWVRRLNGGELCVPELPTIDALSAVVNKEFVLEDGRHVSLQLSFVAGAPVDVDSVIGTIKRQQLSLIVWRHHPYYLTGATYDERIGRDGTRFFEIKELRLADTYSKHPGTEFQKGRDDPGEIDGVLSVKATVLPLR